MPNIYHIVVCGSVVPDPLQTLEPINGPDGPSLKNENMLPAVLDPWAAHALFEAAHLAKQNPGSKVWLVSLGPKQKLQQLMMSIAQKVSFELVVVDASASGFADASETALALASAIEAIPGLDRSRLLLFGGCASAARDAGVTLQLIGEKLGISDLFLGVDELSVDAQGALHILERIEGAQYQQSVCSNPPVVVGWATGNLAEPPNNPQIGMANMRTIMPALQKAQPVKLERAGLSYLGMEVPKQVRQTKVVKDMPPDQIAQEIVDWIKG